jgi:predicted enzyme related to lactoylglutathione lyase
MVCIHPFRRAPKIMFSMLFFAACVSVAQAQFELPALNTPPSGEHLVGKIIWADLVTPDLSAAEKFYGGLFGWTFKRTHAGTSDYSVAMLDGRPIGGFFEKPIQAGQHKQPYWLTFIAVRDVDAAMRSALGHGGKMVASPRTYPQRGQQAVLSDPEGAVFAVLASSSGDPPDYLAAPGDWIWSSLMSKNAGAAAAFYQQVFGYDVFDMESGDGLEHLTLSSDDYARASVNSFSGTARRYSHWLNFVRVGNVAEAAAKAVAMGGRVLVEPRADRAGGMLAVLVDPAGAPFGLMDWDDSDTKTEPK